MNTSVRAWYQRRLLPCPYQRPWRPHSRCNTVLSIYDIIERGSDLAGFVNVLVRHGIKL